MNAPTLCTIDTREAQRPLYNELLSYTFDSNTSVAADYYLVDRIGDIEFYTPNDETWGGIIAIDHLHELAHNTSFYEMDDMASPAPYNDYAMVVVDGVMMCKYETES
jgi:hypothetical protein